MKFPPLSLWSALAAVSLLAAAAPTAQAWTGMGPTWPTQTVRYDVHALSANWQTAANFGATQWTNVSPSGMTFVNDGSSNNDVTRGNIDGRGRTLATTTIYYSGSDITRFLMKFDTSESWYVGSGTTPNGYADAQSIAAHEFGHALGIGHAQSGYCNGTGSSTMCPTYYMGTNYMRSLEADDRNAINTLYP